MKKILIITMFAFISSVTQAGLFSDSKGVINISSDVKGANILIDGKKRGVVGDGVTAIGVVGGAHKVSVLKQTQNWKYEGIENIFASENSSVEVHIATRKIPTQYRLEQIEKADEEKKYRLERDKQRLNTFYRIKVKDGISNEDVEEAMESTAIAENVRSVGMLPISELVELQTEQKQRFLKIFQYSRPMLDMEMIDNLDYFSAYLPFRIALIEAKSGDRYLYTLNLKSIIYDNVKLPKKLRTKMIDMQNTIFEIMKNGSEGKF